MKNNRRITCKNGLSFSVQANQFAYCSPRENYADQYSKCEVGFIEGGEAPSFLEEFRDGSGDVFGYVPVELVEQFIAECGGLDLGVMLGMGGFSKHINY